MHNLEELEQKLQRKFYNNRLLKVALTHSSYGNERHREHYQRLEFLGDSILGMVVAEYLFRRYPQLPEGDLTRKRSNLVCEEALFRVAQSLELEKFILVGRGEQNNGPKPSIMADVVEAIIAAMYLDLSAQPQEQSPLAVTSQWIRQEIIDPWIDVTPSVTDYKSALQELLQRQGKQTILYALIEATGPDHQKEFLVELRVNDIPSGRGTGKTKKEAEQQAAKVAYDANVNK